MWQLCNTIEQLDLEVEEDLFVELSESEIGEFYDPFDDTTMAVKKVGTFGEKMIIGGYSFSFNVYDEESADMFVSPLMLKAEHRNNGLEDYMISHIKAKASALAGSSDCSVHIVSRRTPEGEHDFFGKILKNHGFIDISNKYDKFEDAIGAGEGFICVDYGEPCAYRASHYLWTTNSDTHQVLNEDYREKEDYIADALIEQMIAPAGDLSTLTAVSASDPKESHKIVFAFNQESPYADNSVFIDNTENYYALIDDILMGETVSLILRTSDAKGNETIRGWNCVNKSITALTELPLS